MLDASVPATIGAVAAAAEDGAVLEDERKLTCSLCCNNDKAKEHRKMKSGGIKTKPKQERDRGTNEERKEEIETKENKEERKNKRPVECP